MIHPGLTPDRWYQFSIFEQMANIGCDIDRAVRWRNKKEADKSRGAFDRAMELIDLTILDPKNRGGGLKELTRLRELLKDYFLGSNEYDVLDDTFLYNYFFDFSYAAALQRQK